MSNQAFKPNAGTAAVESLRLKCDSLSLAAAQYIGVDVEVIKGKSRFAPVAMARHGICYILYFNCEANFSQIGRLFSRDHGTAMNSVRRFRGLIAAKDKWALNFMARMGEKVNEIVKREPVGVYDL